VGTYHATLDGAPISIWCTDFFNHSADAQVWESGLGGSSPTSPRPVGQPDRPTLLYKARRGAHHAVRFRTDQRMGVYPLRHLAADVGSHSERRSSARSHRHTSTRI
jgi:hypothetical protein